MHIIDRRKNPSGKSVPNRKRFLDRTKGEIKKRLQDAIEKRALKETGGGTISVPTKGIREPKFHHSDKGGYREGTFPGNKQYNEGDIVPKPQGGADGGGSQGSPDGEGEDDFYFSLTREEFFDLFFDDLELPDLLKQRIAQTSAYVLRRAGFKKTGTPATLDLKRTMLQSRGRNIALRRPSLDEVELLEAEIEKLLKEFREGGKLTPSEEDDIQTRLDALSLILFEKERRRLVVPHIDPIDVRYKNFVEEPKPSTQAVMFCLMDVSGSMGQREKDLAKRFFMLLHYFLQRRYERVQLEFIRHTHKADVVDEETFFYSTETGGTVVSSALEKMKEVIAERYPVGEWNIYAAQASDGENFSDDTERCLSFLEQDILPICQYYAYVEIVSSEEYDMFKDAYVGNELWRGYIPIRGRHKNFAMKHIASPGHIFPVFQELFRKKEGDAHV